MLKKTMVLFGVSSLILVGCNNQDDALPDTNETPMEDMREERDDIVPGTNDETNGINDGINGPDGTTNPDEDLNLDDDMDQTNDEIIEDDMDMNGTNGTNGTNQ